MRAQVHVRLSVDYVALPDPPGWAAWEGLPVAQALRARVLGWPPLPPPGPAEAAAGQGPRPVRVHRRVVVAGPDRNATARLGNITAVLDTRANRVCAPAAAPTPGKWVGPCGEEAGNTQNRFGCSGRCGIEEGTARN